MNIYIKQNNEAVGPYSVEELKNRIYSGELSRTVLASLEGGTEWVPLESLLSGRPVPSKHSSTPVAIQLEQLRDPKEKKALFWLIVMSVPVWGAFAVMLVLTYGMLLLYVALFLLSKLIAEQFFTAYLKTNTVRVSAAQMPELNQVVESCCNQLRIERPEVYVMQHNVWNAFAARMSGQRIVVLYSGAVDSILLKGDLQQLTWLVGHELGHHWAGHLNWGQRLAKLGGWMVWLNLWHSRRAELTCDRVALYCAGNLKASQLALMNATVGAQLASRVNLEKAAEQWHAHKGEFFVKYRTLYSTHPHLLARLVHMNNAAEEFGMSE